MSAIRKHSLSKVGVSNLPNQVHRRSVRQGFDFTLMVIGESGLGKATLLNTLFDTTLHTPKKPAGSSKAGFPSTVTMETLSEQIVERGVRLRLTVVNAPGFGDLVNNEECWKAVLHEIETRYTSYLDQEHAPKRRKVRDTRIHACLYFLQPTGHSLRQIDVDSMLQLHEKVNLIPVIAKADTVTEEDMYYFKARVLRDISQHNIRIFYPSEPDDDDFEESATELDYITDRIPFAVIGSNELVRTPDGRRVRGRAYPWGVVETENERQCDTRALRTMLIRTCMEELRDRTHEELYERWRSQHMLTLGIKQDASVFEPYDPLAGAHRERVLFEAKLARTEAEMRAVFEQKVHDQELKLKQAEIELYARHAEATEVLMRQRAMLEERRRILERDSEDLGVPKKKSGFLR